MRISTVLIGLEFGSEINTACKLSVPGLHSKYVDVIKCGSEVLQALLPYDGMQMLLEHDHSRIHDLQRLPSFGGLGKH